MLGGRLSIAGGVLSVLPIADRKVGSSLPRLGGSLDVDDVYWRQWVRKKAMWGDANLAVSEPSPYYAVLVGRKTGVYYKWYHVQRNICGFEGARYRGCATLAEAYLALAEGDGKAAEADVELPRLDYSAR